MAKRRKKMRINKLLLPISIILVVSVFVAAAAMYQYRPPPETQKLPASEYFQILNATVINGEFNANRTILQITEIEFWIKATGGAAHSIYVYGIGQAEGQEIGDLQKGESRNMDLKATYAVTVRKESQGWPLDITVTSNEAEGTVRCWLKEE